MRIIATHPGPIVHTPTRARVERLAYDRMRTRIEIPELSEGEMPLAGGIEEWQGKTVPVALHEGSLWTAVRDWLQRPMGAADLAAFLSEDAPVGDGAAIPDTLYLTPFHVPAPSDALRPVRGTAIEPVRMGRLSEDHRDESQAAVRAFAVSSLRLRGGRPWIRIPGPFAVPSPMTAPGDYKLTTRPYVHARSEVVDTFCDPGAIAAHHARWMRDDGDPKASRLMSHGVGVPLPSPRGDILRFAANHGVTCAHREMRRIVANGGLSERSLAALRQAQARLAPHVAMASVFAIPLSGVAEPIQAVAAALAGPLKTLDRKTSGYALLRRQALWGAAAFAPLLDRDVPTEDLDALAGLGM